ncbi:EF-hand domain-containing protein [Pseudoscourfieldia marina]
MSSLHVSSGYHVGAWHSVLRGYDATLKSMTSLTRFAWPFDQFKRHVYDPRAASATSALASLFWYACVTAFAAVAITNFINRPEVDTFGVMPAKELPPLEITIETKCSEEWGCTPNAQPLPALFSMGPCPYEPGFNRSYTCVNHKPNALNSTLDQVREREAERVGLGGRRKLLHNHLWTWLGAVTATQRYKGAKSKCAAKRTAVANAWVSRWGKLSLNNTDAKVDADELAGWAADPTAAVDKLFAKLDADNSGALDGEELSIFNKFAEIMLSLANLGEFEKMNATHAGGFRDSADFPAQVLEVAKVSIPAAQYVLLGFGVTCDTCVTHQDYIAKLSEAMQKHGAATYKVAQSLENGFHPWVAMLSGDPFYPDTSVGIDGWPLDGKVTPYELQEAIGYVLRHGTVTPEAFSQAAASALAADPLGAQEAPLQLCAVDVAAGDDQLGGLLLHTDFPEGCAYGTAGCNTRLQVTLSDGKPDGMRLQIDLEPSQRKAVQVGVTVRKWSGKPDKYELRADDLFYVGKNDDRRASLRIGLKQYAEVIETSRPGDYLTVFGAIGGFGSLLLSVLGILLAVMAAVETVYDDIKTGTFRFREVAAELVGEGAELRDDEKADLPEEKAAPRANSSSPRADDKYLPDAA